MSFLGRLTIGSAVTLTLALMGLSVVIVQTPEAGPPLLAFPPADAQSSDEITFYGVPFQADAFVWCLDISASMSWNSEIDTLKAETALAISQLRSDQRFSVTAFSTNVQSWSHLPLPGIPQNQLLASSWIHSLVPAGWTCLEGALLQSLDILFLAPVPEKAILLVVDGEAICQGVDTGPQVLASVTAANFQGVSIHVLYLSADTGGISFYQQLATLNHGTFILPGVSPPPPPPPSPPRFLRGDADGNGIVTGLVDSVFLLRYQYLGGLEPPCFDAADANDDGSLTVWVEDAIYLLAYQFRPGQPPPPPPGPRNCGVDETHDLLTCRDPACP